MLFAYLLMYIEVFEDMSCWQYHHILETVRSAREIIPFDFWLGFLKQYVKKVLLKPCVNTAFGIDICITNTKIPFSAGRSNIRWPSTATKFLESSYWRSNQICHHHTLLSKEGHICTFSCKIWYSIVQIIFLSGTTSRFSGGTWHLFTPSKQVQG